MPELPEVETIVRQLDRFLRGKQITAVAVNHPKIVGGKGVAVKRALIGRKIVGVERRAKIVSVRLDNGRRMIVHLKMTGQLIYRNCRGQLGAVGGHPIVGGIDDLPNKYSHVIITFNDSSQLFFNDQRRFGWLRVVDEIEWRQINERHGIEPLSRQFSSKAIAQLCVRFPRRPIKQLLMDQAHLVGIGNIYADEACFAARVRPQRPSGTITPAEQQHLVRSIPVILRRAIAKGGTTADNYRQANGSRGGFLPFLKVYGRGGKPCRRCHKTIVKTKLGGRGTHYCPQCQR